MKHHTAFTLMEMLVSLTILSIISVGIGSSMLLAGRALPEASAPSQVVLATSPGVERLCSDLNYATQILAASATGLTFTVADRDADTMPETLAYTWSGMPGDPLLLQTNIQTPLVLLPHVETLSLVYDTDTVRAETANGNESGQTTLASHNATWDFLDYDIKDDCWIGQVFKPALPADAIGWSVQRVEFYAKSTLLGTGVSQVELQAATAGAWPTGVVYEAKTLLESSLLYNYLLRSFTFTTVTDLPPDQGVCLVIRYISGTKSCTVLTHDKATGLSSMALLKTTDGGATWSKPSQESRIFWVFGTVTTPGTPDVVETRYLQAVNVTVNTSTTDDTLVQTAVPVLNHPEVSL
jgi:prepilin-type N-terminal cleavage/methylation domain-containing protein